MLVDTHCHIHDATYPLDVADALLRANEAGVEKMICVGTDEQSSLAAIDLAQKHDHIYASIGVHPHDTKDGYGQLEGMSSPKIVAVGEIGLDYFYGHSPREIQIAALRHQIELAIARDLPIIFHVRDVFDDFWPIFDSYDNQIKGVLHSFTDSHENMTAATARGL
ncbi:MAG: TatD family hydrolase, partial [Candidatus Saccharimonadales bacterium]